MAIGLKWCSMKLNLWDRSLGGAATGFLPIDPTIAATFHHAHGRSEERFTPYEGMSSRRDLLDLDGRSTCQGMRYTQPLPPSMSTTIWSVKKI